VITLGICAPLGLYGVAPLIAQLVRIDPKTGGTTNIGQPIDNDYDAQGLAAIDDKKEVIYLVVTDDTNHVILLGLSLNDGSIKTNIKLPFNAGTFVGVGQSVNLDPVTGDLFVSGRDPSVANKHQIYRVSIASGALTPIASIGGEDVLDGISTYDSINKVLWIEFATNTTINLYGFDVTSGKLLFNIVDDAFNMETMDFDPVTGLIYGIGLTLKNDTYAFRTVVSLNSKNGQLKQIAVVDKDEYYIIDGSAGALDITNRIIYCFLQPRGSDSNPFDLVGVDIRSGKVVNGSPVGCADSENCAWSMEFHNKPSMSF